jgi:hypothetical protein
MGSVRLGQMAVRFSFFSWTLNPSADGAGWLALDIATMRIGSLFDGTLLHGIDHVVNSYSLLQQTANTTQIAKQTCQIPYEVLISEEN